MTQDAPVGSHAAWNRSCYVELITPHVYRGPSCRDARTPRGGNARGGIRTLDPQFRKLLLSPLSYPCAQLRSMAFPRTLREKEHEGHRPLARIAAPTRRNKVVLHVLPTDRSGVNMVPRRGLTAAIRADAPLGAGQQPRPSRPLSALPPSLGLLGSPAALDGAPVAKRVIVVHATQSNHFLCH